MWIELFDIPNIVFQLDGAPTHNKSEIREFFSITLPDRRIVRSGNVTKCVWAELEYCLYICRANNRVYFGQLYSVLTFWFCTLKKTCS